MEHTSLCLVTCGASSIGGIRNFGDELLEAIYTNWLGSTRPGIEARHLKTGRLGSMDARKKALFEQADRLVFIGGGYFGEGHFPELNASSQFLRKQAWGIRNAMVYGNAYSSARRHRVPVAVLGVEVGPITSLIFRHTVRSILCCATDVVVRNESSREYVLELCQERVQPEVCLDAALAIERDEVNLLASSRPLLPTELTPHFNIGIHIHGLGTSRYNQDCLQLIELIRRVVPVQRSVSYFYLHDQTKNDKHPSRSGIAEQFFRSQLPALETIPYVNWVHTVSAVAKMSVLITTKLHVGIVARALGIPVISLPYHQKTQKFFAAVGELDCCAPVEVMNKRGLPPRLTGFFASPTPKELPVHPMHKQSALRNRSAVHRIVRSTSVR